MYNGEEICGGFAYYDSDEVDAAIAELKAQLESEKASRYAESVDAGMRERRLKRALYKACAMWAKERSLYYYSAVPNLRRCILWEKVETKCRAMAEEYK
jgi:hypothetical protein